MHDHLTLWQEDKLDRLHSLLCQLQEEVEELATETGNEHIKDAALSLNDVVLSLGVVSTEEIALALHEAKEQKTADDTVIEVDEDDIPF